ncbi:hypothetical protein CDAR_254941 [Caerostris darwini]|uniref:Uncharacterized protein n=1 Tax=Caerostris darwini TaxID=1538125 RepID=A0AAV4VBI6_9ARAC|nr:hypothetical protein CDAR_254941 [Caerostris darwini]
MQAQKDARFADVFGCPKSRMRSLLVVRQRRRFHGRSLHDDWCVVCFCAEQAARRGRREIPYSGSRKSLCARKRNAEFLEIRFFPRMFRLC